MSEQSFAARLKRLREEAGLSQAELAQRAGMNRFGVAKLEQGVREPSWATVQTLARALGVAVGDFVVEGGGAPKPAPAASRPRKTPAPGDAPDPKPTSRPRKAPVAAEEPPAAGKATSAPPAKKKPATKARGRRKGKEQR